MNHYEILEVSQNASQDVIRAAYKSLMQRYHPDRNPGNTKTAEHASLIAQAYEVLADSNRRSAYDIELQRHLTDRLNIIRDKGREVLSPAASSAKESESSWLLWLLIAVIVLSGWLILSLSKKQQSPESELREIRSSFEGNLLTQKQRQAKINRIDEIIRSHPGIQKKEAGERAKEVAARTIPIFISNLTVNIRVPDQAPGNSGHVLSIPVLSAIVGTFDSDKFIRHIESNNEFISNKLAEKLAYAKYEELTNTNGEQYLKKFILDSIGEITGTNRYEDYPSSMAEAPGRYGVIGVLFPESFSVH